MNTNSYDLFNSQKEDMKEYVAELQLHMTLQARNLLPDLAAVQDSRVKLLQDTQADVEKIISRQTL
jgi:hypothetical protein